MPDVLRMTAVGAAPFSRVSSSASAAVVKPYFPSAEETTESHTTRFA